MQMEVTLPGNLRVDAHFKGHRIPTDQPTRHGGEDSAPAPFDLFLASIATCAGFYVAQFLRQREISTEGVRLTLDTTKDRELNLIGEISIVVHLPSHVPEKYRQAILRAVDQCSVKKHLARPPQVTTAIEQAEPAAAGK